MPTQTHRLQTLQAIAQKARDMNARIEFLKVEGRRVKNLFDGMPADASSRIDWLHRRLQEI